MERPTRQVMVEQRTIEEVRRAPNTVTRNLVAATKARNPALFTYLASLMDEPATLNRALLALECVWRQLAVNHQQKLFAFEKEHPRLKKEEIIAICDFLPHCESNSLHEAANRFEREFLQKLAGVLREILFVLEEELESYAD